MLLLCLVALLVVSASAQIQLLGAIYGADGVFCDAFYASSPACQGAQRCSLPLAPKVCSYNGTSYGQPNDAPINVMHVNYQCGHDNVFRSANLVQGDAPELVIECAPSSTEKSADQLAEFRKRPITTSAPSQQTTSSQRAIKNLGTVIGGGGQFCDAYFRAAKKCDGQKSCELPIDASLCEPGLGSPNSNQTLNFMHIMFSCGGDYDGFHRLDVRQLAKVAVLTC